MKGAFCYLPILRAMQGEFKACQRLSPQAQARMAMLFDVPHATPGKKTVDDYLRERALGIYSTVGRRSVYVDVHDLPLDLRVSSGALPVEYLVDNLNAFGSQAVPVTGLLADRGEAYVNAVAAIVARDRRGVCIRLAEEDVNEPDLLRETLAELLKRLHVDASQVDILADLRYIGGRPIEPIRAASVEALDAMLQIGPFRNVVLAGSSIPHNLSAQDAGNIRRVPRLEFDLWAQVSRNLAGRVPLAFGDHGVMSAHFVPPGKPVRVPARIRYTIPGEHIFYREARARYPQICEHLTASTDFAGNTSSWGDSVMSARARGSSGPGGPADWVATDTNHHLEVVAAEVWEYLRAAKLSEGFLLPEPEPRPWLQPALS